MIGGAIFPMPKLSGGLIIGCTKTYTYNKIIKIYQKIILSISILGVYKIYTVFYLYFM